MLKVRYGEVQQATTPLGEVFELGGSEHTQQLCTMPYSDKPLYLPMPFWVIQQINNGVQIIIPY